MKYCQIVLSKNNPPWSNRKSRLKRVITQLWEVSRGGLRGIYYGKKMRLFPFVIDNDRNTLEVPNKIDGESLPRKVPDPNKRVYVRY